MTEQYTYTRIKDHERDNKHHIPRTRVVAHSTNSTSQLKESLLGVQIVKIHKPLSSYFVRVLLFRTFFFLLDYFCCPSD